MGQHAGDSIKSWWGWGLAWILSKKPVFAQDLEMNEEEAKALGSQNRGSWIHILYKFKSEIRKVIVRSDKVGLPQTYRGEIKLTMATIYTTAIAGASINSTPPPRNSSISIIQFRSTKSKQFAARRKDDSNKNNSSPPQPDFRLKLPGNILIAKLVSSAAVAVFALGFVDAGYSGDWSRIGAISKETEELLKVASFLVVPFCALIVISIAKSDES
ncbi:hypothetical protein LINPERPRIM_LOCUS27349 [Linum perenne]